MERKQFIWKTGLQVRTLTLLTKLWCCCYLKCEYFIQVFGIFNQKIVDFYINFAILKHCIKVFISIMKFLSFKLCTRNNHPSPSPIWNRHTLSTNENVVRINHQGERLILEKHWRCISDLGRDEHCLYWEMWRSRVPGKQTHSMASLKGHNTERHQQGTHPSHTQVGLALSMSTYDNHH